MKVCKLIVNDFVNVRFEGLDPATRRKLHESLKFMVPNARHMPMFQLKRWDGTISFCSINGATYFNLLDRLLPIIDEEGYDVEIIDKRPEFSFRFPEITDELFADKLWPIGHDKAGESIILRDYQVDAIKTFIENLQSIQELCTGLGKTILTAALSYTIEPYGRSIIVVPSKSLVIQTERDYINTGLDVGVYYGDRKEWGHKHTICTWQSLAIFSKNSKNGGTDITIQEFLKDVVCVIIDEVHVAKAKELKNLLTGPCANVPIRWGLTGTIPKDDHEAISLFASLGPKVGEIRADYLQERGVLADCDIDIIQLVDDHVEFSDYDSEHKFLLEDDERLEHIASIIQEASKDGNTLCLIDRIETGHKLKKLIPKSVFIFGNVKNKIRQEEYDSIQNEDDKTIIATYGCAAVGINAPRLFNIFLLEAGKSFTRCIQSIGRGLRKAHDKKRVRIVDLCSSLKFSKRHLTKRKIFYDDANYPYKMKKITYR